MEAKFFALWPGAKMLRPLDQTATYLAKLTGSKIFPRELIPVAEKLGITVTVQEGRNHANPS